MSRYDELLAEVQRLRRAGILPAHLTREERIDWAYGNTKLANADVTRDFVERAVDGRGPVS
jgi:hypothetical protein